MHALRARSRTHPTLAGHEGEDLPVVALLEEVVRLDLLVLQLDHLPIGPPPAPLPIRALCEVRRVDVLT